MNEKIWQKMDARHNEIMARRTGQRAPLVEHALRLHENEVYHLLRGGVTHFGSEIKPQPKNKPVNVRTSKCPIPKNSPFWFGREDLRTADWVDADCVNPGVVMRCPYKVGDVVWIQEKWAMMKIFDELTPAMCRFEKSPIWYVDGVAKRGVRGRWRPASHMPRWASRIICRIVKVSTQKDLDTGVWWWIVEYRVEGVWK